MTEKARILFVDDEKRVLNAMRGLFRREYELFLTTDGAEAIRLVAENAIDVVVADQRMPGLTGIEVLGKIKEISPRTVRILLTGYADPTAVEGSINIGEVFRFLSKPCPPQMLRETLKLAVSAAQTKPVIRNESAVPTAAPATTVKLKPTPEERLAPERKPAPEQRPAPPVAEQRPAARPEPDPVPESPVRGDDEDTVPALPILTEEEIAARNERSSTHWHSVTNVVMSEDSVEETQEQMALPSSVGGMKDVGIVVFTVDSDFASTAIRAMSADSNTILATTLVKVARAIQEQSAGVLVTDFTTNNTMLQKMIGTLKQLMPELVTIVVSNGRDTTDMINLINYGQVFRYVLKPIEPEQLRGDINAAVIQHLYLLNNPESAKRHHVLDSPDPEDESSSMNRILGRFRKVRAQRRDPTDTIA